MRDFDRLLKPKRFRTSETTIGEDRRNPFENDFSRIVFSSAFRRLQDKTQVFQLDKGDFVRTRLTHSMEVSALGRSIGISIEERLIDSNYLSPEKRGHIPSILATSGLVHDLGNPPFGHFGEEAIRDYFKHLFKDNPSLAEELSESEKMDLLYFDGNVQTFRVLRKLHYLKDREGMNMTFPVLATIVKYPYSSLEGNNRKRGLPYKKYGFFQSEKEDYASIKKEFSLKGRYPLTYLLESADDIAYLFADVEDACKKNILGYSDIMNYLKGYMIPLCSSDREGDFDYPSLFENLYNSVEKGYKNKLEVAIQQFRIKVQGDMITAVVDEFMNNIDKIMGGEYEGDLLNNSFCSSIRKTFSAIGDHIFSHKSIVENEIIGHRVLTYLLEEFVPAAIDAGRGEELKQPRFYSLISSNYRFIYENFTDRTIYSRIQLALDYISGMTDNFALKRYRQFHGI